MKHVLQSTSHPLFHLQVFSDCTSLYALTEEDSRLFYEWASVVGGGGVGGVGAQRQRQKVRKRKRHRQWVLWGRGIIVVPFCCLMFLFSSSFARLLQVQKRPDMQGSCHPRGVFFMEGCLDSSPISPPWSPHLPWSFCSPGYSWALPHVSLQTSSLPSCPAGQLVRACSLPRLWCLEPHWNANWVSGEESTSLINQEAPHSLFTATTSNHFKPTATVNCHQCRHWLSGFISVCLPCQINAFITARCPRRRPQMNISCHL